MSQALRYKLDHIAFWVFTVLFHAYTRYDLVNTSGVGVFLSEVFIRNILLAGVIYMTILKAIPFLTEGKKLQGLGIIISSIIVYVALKDAHDIYLSGANASIAEKQSLLNNSFYNLSIVLFYLAFASTLHLSKQWFIQRDQMRKMEIEKLNTELDYLRAQMNPHFLFNSINTIYFQIDKQNIAARETLNKFSDMLRYQLYECNGNEIAIEKEIKYLRSYADLQRLRMNENHLVTFHVDDSIKNFKLPPLLFIPFIENAFKHVSHFNDRKNEIHIQLTRIDNHLTLEVANTKEEQAAEPKDEGGIGLKNISRRLELLYDTRFELQIHNLSVYFKVHLTVPIA